MHTRCTSYAPLLSYTPLAVLHTRYRATRPLPCRTTLSRYTPYRATPAYRATPPLPRYIPLCQVNLPDLLDPRQLQELLQGQDYHMMETEIEALLLKAKAEARPRETNPNP